MGHPLANLEQPRSLAQLLEEGHAFPAGASLELMRRLTVQVERLHREGRTHRAIGADQVTMDRDLRPQLSAPAPPRGFGGPSSDPDCCPPELTPVEAVVLPEGIEAAAGELARRGCDFDPRRIDVYQLGTLLCRLLTGAAVLGYLYDPIVKAKVPAALRGLLDAALGHDPKHRLGDCDALVRALDAAAEQLGSTGAADSLRETPPRGRTAQRDADTPVLGVGAPRAASAPREAEPSLPFQRLGHFRISARIGAGGMGDVYLGYDESLNRRVAIKVLPAELARDEDFVRRFRAEASAAAKISHPNIIPIHFIGEEGGHHFFAMQYVDGPSLAERLKQRACLPVEEALRIVQQCLEGLGAAHAEGLVHRDVKPGNVLIERASGRAVLVDFGLVRSTGQGTRWTATGVIMGTVDYIAPEQARGQAVDHRADLYALGVLFYELLAGRLPFQAESPTAMLFQHAYEEPFPLDEAAPDVPAPVLEIVACMMAKDPEARYAGCEQVLSDIEAFLAGRPIVGGSAGVDDGRPGALPVAPQPAEAIAPSELPALIEPRGPASRFRDWAATLFRRHAPDALKQLQTTTQQVDAAVAAYARRRRRLATLLAEARSVVAELSEQARSNRDAAAAASRKAESATSEEAQRTALAEKEACQERAETLENRRDQQLREIDGLELELHKADATLARLRSQRDLLRARLRSAEVRGALGPKRGLPARRLLVAAVGVCGLAVGLLLWVFAGTAGSPPSPPPRPPQASPTEPGPQPSAPLPDRPPLPEVISEMEASGRLITNSVGMRFVLIPAGEFTMGTPQPEIDALSTTPEAFRVFDEEHGPNECPAHRVLISKPFYMGVNEVTQGQFIRVVGYNPSKYALGPGDRSRYPVENVDYREAVAFCETLSALPAESEAGRTYRLPTEAEWEYACRAGSQTHFAFGDQLDSTQANFLPHSQSTMGNMSDVPAELKGTMLVGSYPSNRSGLYDVHGNVWEWCLDHYDPDYYETSPSVDPQGPTTGSHRVFRGGAYSSSQIHCRSAYRGHEPPDSKDRLPLGFRVVLVVADSR